MDSVLRTSRVETWTGPCPILRNLLSELVETAVISCGTSHASAVSTPLRWIFKKKKTRYKASHSCTTTDERSESAQESGE